MSFINKRFSSVFYTKFLYGFGAIGFLTGSISIATTQNEISVEKAWQDVGYHMRKAMAGEFSLDEKTN